MACVSGLLMMVGLAVVVVVVVGVVVLTTALDRVVAWPGAPVLMMVTLPATCCK